MIKISSTKLRNNLFSYLEKVKAGEVIVISRNKKDVAKLVPVNGSSDWRDNVKIELRLTGRPDEIIGPLEDIWQDYV